MGTSLLLVMLSLLGMSRGQAEPLDEFIVDIIATWHLQLPTIAVADDMPELCWTREKVLCTTNENAMDTKELAEHLVIMHSNRAQDGLIFLGSEVHQLLLDVLTQLVPAMFTSDCPVFMPIEYAEGIKLRLDSNILFYEKSSHDSYKLLDIFSIKGGPLIRLDLCTWVKTNGFIFKNRMNRWERRNDLKGVTFINSLLDNGNWAWFIIDDAGSITGSWGFLQELLFCITEKMKMTIETTEVPYEPWMMLENGSWMGGIGILQRKEVDIVSVGLGQTSERCSSVIDCPLSVPRDPFTLYAAKPKGATLDVWAYVNVFGTMQWAIFLALIIAFVMMTIVFNCLGEESEQSKLRITLQAIEIAYLFMIQLGDHANRKQGMRLLTLTISILTLLMYVHYANDITAKMTSGTPEIPIRTFEDVIHHGFKVIVQSQHYKSVFAAANPGTAKYQVYKKYIENDKIRGNADFEAEKEIIAEPKTLLFSQKLMVASHGIYDIITKEILDQIVALKMDDAGYAISGFGLQNDSEFLKMFNYYLLKEKEHGIMTRLYRKYFIYLYTNEEFGMIEPQPLGIDNVMFTFSCLGVGFITALIIAMVEFMVRKLDHIQRSPLNKFRDANDPSIPLKPSRRRRFARRPLKAPLEVKLNPSSVKT